MLTFEQIKELIELVAKRKLGGLEVERAGFRLKIAGPESALRLAAAAHASAVAPAAAMVGAHEAPAVLAAPAGGAEPAVEAAAASGTPVNVVTSPIVGTYYSAPSPDADPYVRVGDRVKKGQVLCIVEAMKLMNEIESDVDGVVVQIFPKNAQPVEFGEQLFAIRPD